MCKRYDRGYVEWGPHKEVTKEVKCALLSADLSKAHIVDVNGCVPRCEANNYTLMLCLCTVSAFLSQKSTTPSCSSYSCSTPTCTVNLITMATHHFLHRSFNAPSPPAPPANMTDCNITRIKRAWWEHEASWSRRSQAQALQQTAQQSRMYTMMLQCKPHNRW